MHWSAVMPWRDPVTAVISSFDTQACMRFVTVVSL